MIYRNEFETIKLPIDLVTDLGKKQALNSRPRQFLDKVFQNGGYIAGGFATVLARHYLLKPENDDVFIDQINRHLGQPEEPRPSNPFVNVGCCDIDVWFPDKEHLDSFFTNLGDLTKFSVGPTTSGAAVGYIMPNQAIFQVITKYLRPEKEQLQAFDIYNGAVAVNANEIVVPLDWYSLEEKNVLHVSNWSSSWTINRFFKWINRKKYYKSVTPSTARHVYDHLKTVLEFEKEISQEEKERLKFDKLYSRITKSRVQTQEFLSTIMSALPVEDLLFLPAMFPEPPNTILR